MSKYFNFTNDKSLDFERNEFKNNSLIEIDYLNKRLSFLERVIQDKYSDIISLASEICNVQNMNLKYDLIDILIKHGYNLSNYKSERNDIRDILINANKNKQTKSENNVSVGTDMEIIINDIDDKEPHNSDSDTNKIVSKNESKVIIEVTDQNKDSKSQDIKDIGQADLKAKEIETTQKSKSDTAREKILNNLNRLISYKENTFNDLIEMVDFNTSSNANKSNLSKFIECLESQIVELNQYKDNILKNYSLSKAIELGSNGKITFSRVFIEKERLIDKNKDEYIKIVNEMYELYSEFVDTYLNNISSMKPYLDHEKITSIQNNCAKVIYDLKLIRTLYSSLDKIKSV
ncbi:hypothetical protein [Candidatus Arthromitus sp. SFB-rat-Yit]|uniref:hypothetical protein n=1 Tax=Candidatus Arthromitus sp. SFB-rat-Yit TaxID=1041504 RepID=UPI000227A1F2|nr:hypothetical protein [Candidatus Arthromitus sp. SFB-rat-Yit]BAK81370.1 hypothetical protein RATSFB_0808 [Candidatus Arthromitus sp. SFB-rat-Yit]